MNMIADLLIWRFRDLAQPMRGKKQISKSRISKIIQSPNGGQK
jgi:hypothetical protein